LEDWIKAWIAFRILEASYAKAEYFINGRKCLGIFGTIGLDSAFTSDGEVLVALGFEEEAVWRVATREERTWVIVCAQRNRYPELSVLLPLRPEDAVDCANCRGSGFVHGQIISCKICSALGWVSGGET
jgi:hypothetical protein